MDKSIVLIVMFNHSHETKMNLLFLDTLFNLLQCLNILVDLANTINGPIEEEY